jgi:membrane protein DedA with SNARE-associated domain
MLDEAGLTKQIIAFMQANRGWVGPIVFVLAFGESLAFISLVLPFWGILVAIGGLVGMAGGLDFWTILICASVGAALGDWLSYWLGWHYHKEIKAMWPLNKYPHYIAQGEQLFSRYGAWAVVLARFSGPLRASVPIIAGAVRMPSATFQLANWSSAFLWAATLLLFGGSLGQLWVLLTGKG